jgi:GAF domain-containing protein
MEVSEGTFDVDRDTLSDLTLTVSETARILFSAGSVTDTLASVVQLARDTIEGCDYAGIFLLNGEVVTTPARTDPFVVEIDALQHRYSEGPCLDAIRLRLVFYADDLSTDLRWPSFAPEANAAGIRSVLALPLYSDAQRGVLNLYANYPVAFGVVDRARAAILASLATLALSAAHTHDDEGLRTESLQAALVTREVIGQALGILMERERITTQQAFDILRRASQHLNITLREVAQQLVDTGTDPSASAST